MDIEKEIAMEADAIWYKRIDWEKGKKIEIQVQDS